MSPISSLAVSTSLIGAGGLAWVLTGPWLIANADLQMPLNPLGINRSPYGEVFAMALQGPIDTYFNEGMFSGSHRHPAAAETNAQPSPQAETPATPHSWTSRWEALVNSLNQVAAARTNPQAASPALKRHLRRQAEDKLRFAYQLDPSHYGNYNSLHFFLTEPEVGTRPELTPSASQLAQETIHYCLQQNQDPRPALTAAAAATNILHLMFNDAQDPAPKFDTLKMRQCLNLLDLCIARYNTIAQEWDQSQHWDLLSPQRINECQDRYYFICKIRNDAEQTVLRLERKKDQHQAAN